MPILGTLLFNVFTGLFAFFAKYLTQKVALAGAIVVIVSGLYAAFYVALSVLLGQATMAVYGISPQFAMGLSIFVPSSAASLVSSYITFWSACELYKWKLQIVQIWARTI